VREPGLGGRVDQSVTIDAVGAEVATVVQLGLEVYAS
jgi:hypothetical protein